MADVPEYDGYLEIDEDQLREAFIQVNENIRALQKRLKEAEKLIKVLQTTTSAKANQEYAERIANALIGHGGQASAVAHASTITI